MKHEETQIEKQFEETCQRIHPQIQEKLAAAAQLIDEAVKLSEQHGVPFRPKEEIMFCRPSYIPYSMQQKFPKLDWEFWTEVSKAHNNDECEGWQHSQVC